MKKITLLLATAALIAPAFTFAQSAEQLKQHGKFNIEKDWDVLENLLPILQFIHSHQVIHGDIKPANIIAGNKVASDIFHKNTQIAATLTLVDFSSAKLVDKALLCALNPDLGSAEYAAPLERWGVATVRQMGLCLFRL